MTNRRAPAGVIATRADLQAHARVVGWTEVTRTADRRPAFRVDVLQRELKAGRVVWRAASAKLGRSCFDRCALGEERELRRNVGA